METRGCVLDIDRFSTHDGPGIRMAVFLKGCPLACRWCHSPESQDARPQLLYQSARCRACGRCVAVCPRGAIALLPDGGGITIDRANCAGCFACAKACWTRALRVAGTSRTVEEIAEIARRDREFHRLTGGGATISGGEPLAQAAFTLALARALRRIPTHTALETAGMGDTRALMEIARETDLLFFDVKIIDDGKHRRFTGVSNARILCNLRSLAADRTLCRRVCVRTPCIPGVNDSPEEILAIARLARALGIRHMELMPYNAMANAKYEWLDRPYPLAPDLECDRARFTRLEEVVANEGLTPEAEGEKTL